MDRLRFGIFLSQFHRAGEKPTLALQRDLEHVEHLYQCDYDEAYIVEKHYSGIEFIDLLEIYNTSV